MPQRPAALRTVGLLLAAGVWLFGVLSLASYSPTDWPSHAVAAYPERAANWCGPFGGWTAYHLVAAVGPAAWPLLAVLGLFVALKLARVNVGDLWLRGAGLAVLVAAVAAGSHEYAANVTGLPEGDGGVVGLAAAGYLRQHFGVAGTRLAILLAGLAGTLLVCDELFFAWPAALLGKLRQVKQDVATASAKQKPVEVTVPRLSLPKLSMPSVSLPRFKFARAEPAKVEPKVKRSKRVVTVPEVEDEIAGETPPVRAELSDEIAMSDATADSVDEEPEEIEPDPDIEPEPVVADNDVPPVERDLSKIKVKLPSMTKVKRTAPPPPKELGEYELPQWDVLEDAEQGFAEGQEAFVRDKAVQLEAAFEEFGVDAQVTEIDTGPVITMYEIAVSRGTKVSAITGLANDLARTLAAESIRVVAPIPGKNTIGIEVPNAEKEKVRLKELMQLAPEKTGKMAIPLYLGKNSSGEPLIADLAGMPHCLIAGTTGSGKSVCINTVIMSIMYTQRPDMVKLILVDPKVVEMAPFKDIPHLMCPVITDAAKATNVLEWCCTKMDERYELLAEAGVRNIAGYNKLTTEELIEKFEPTTPQEEAKIPKKLPYMVVIIDELADLMMTSGKEVESHIVRIAQKARAVGIHLILATQRPQANVVTGLIKSNMPSKIAFRVASKMDSRIVMDQNGAEVLLGQGDMLYLPPGASKPVRSQGTFIDDHEIRLSVKKVKELAEAQYEPELVQIKNGINVAGDEERDPLYDDAVRVVLETRRGSVSLLQRKLTIGYARASRMIEQMAADGIVGDYKGSQAREATLTVEEWEELRAAQAAEAEDQGQGEDFDESADAEDFDPDAEPADEDRDDADDADDEAKSAAA